MAATSPKNSSVAPEFNYNYVGNGTYLPMIARHVFSALHFFAKDNKNIRVLVEVNSYLGAIRSIDPGKEQLDSTQFHDCDAKVIEGLFRGKTFCNGDRIELEVKDFEGLPDGLYDVKIDSMYSLQFVFPKPPAPEPRQHSGSAFDE